MNKRFLIIMLALVAACAAAFAAQRVTPSLTGQGQRWEYGVFRIGGYYQYEWQDAERRVYGESLKIFMEKMNLQELMNRIESLRDAPQSSLQYVGEGIFVNHVGQQGWELVLLSDRGPAGIDNKTYWFKRPARSGR